MIVVVADANILIDLLKIELVDEFFKLNFDFHATDLVLGEIEEPNFEILNQYIKCKKMHVINFDSEEIEEIEHLSQLFRILSIPDCSCIKACRKIKAVLVTGDKKLKKIGKEMVIETHGIFWIFKNLLDQEIMKSDLAKQKIIELSNKNHRLSANEIEKFIESI